MESLDREREIETCESGIIVVGICEQKIVGFGDGKWSSSEVRKKSVL